MVSPVFLRHTCPAMVVQERALYGVGFTRDLQPVIFGLFSLTVESCSEASIEHFAFGLLINIDRSTCG